MYLSLRIGKHDGPVNSNLYLCSSYLLEAFVTSALVYHQLAFPANIYLLWAVRENLSQAGVVLKSATYEKRHGNAENVCSLPRPEIGPAHAARYRFKKQHPSCCWVTLS